MSQPTHQEIAAVDLLPIGSIERTIVDGLAARLSRHVTIPCHVLAPAALVAPRIARREQVDASALLALLESRDAAGDRLLVGVTGEDIAVPVFSFVFGLARQGGRACVVSLARVDPAFYGLPADPNLRDERAAAEALHEMGHLASLTHCLDVRCLMYFSGNVERVDARGMRFCGACAERLPAWLRGHSLVMDGPG